MKRILAAVGSVLVVSTAVFVFSLRADAHRAYIDYLKGDNICSIADAVKSQPRDTKEAHLRATALINMVEECKKKLFAIPATKRTYANTVRLYDEFKGLYRIGKEAIDFHRMLSPDVEGRDAPYDRVKREKARLYVDPRIYNAFKEYEQYGMHNEQLTEEEKYFFYKFMRRFKRQGVDLPEEQQEEVRRLQAEAADAAGAFQAAINRDTSFIAVAEQDLDGVDESFIASCKRDDKGRLIVPANGPSWMAVMPHCKNGDVRKSLYYAYQNRAYPENKENLRRMCLARHKLGRALGFNNYADMSLDGMMIRTMPSDNQSPSKNVQAFIDSLTPGALKKAAEEFAEKTAELPEGVSLIDGKMLPWDASYVGEQYAKKFNYDSREVAKYFPVKKTIEGIFKIYETFMNLDFELTECMPEEIRGSFHESVQVMTVYTKGRQRLLGYIFMDLFPRPGKYSHACCGMTMPSSRVYDNDSGRWIQTTGINVLIANFPKPSGDNPGLLTHHNVTTFFHEFGHAIHALLGNNSFRKLTGYNVIHDFVELPSQILEEWMWDRECLRLVSGHYQTGEKLPHDLIDTMFALRKIRTGGFLAGQLSLTEMALRIHTQEYVDIDVLDSELKAKYSPNSVMIDPAVHHYAAFGHLQHYGAGYYGYLFSRAYGIDVLEGIKQDGSQLGVNGLLSPFAGARFVKEILRPGGGRHPNDSLVTYLRRPPNLDAFKRLMGIDKE